MAIKGGRAVKFFPEGLVDSFDATNIFKGACTSMQNVVFDQVNRQFAVTRAGVLSLASFITAGFSTPTFISIQQAIGTYIYGMITTTLHAGFDQPFVYNTTTGAFLAISGITGANVPNSPASSGADWTPPTLAVVGTMVIITHPGFNGTNGFFGTIDISNPASPAWRSGNTATNALPCVPVAVANFNNRAWFAGSNVDSGTADYRNWLFFSDVLTNPLTQTNASQALVVGSNLPINALAGLPNQTTSSGIIQTLTVFKQTQIWQISGDSTTANLSLNYLSLNIGTLMPRTIVQVPVGLYFVSSGGPYVVNLLGAVMPLVHGQEPEPDIQIPFQNAVTPTRWCAAYNSTIYRICGPTVINGTQTTNDYWFDEHRRRWSGPHTFAYDCASAYGDQFILTSYLQPGLLLQNSPNPGPIYPNNDLGTAITFTVQTATWTNTEDMLVNQVTESAGEFSTINGQQTITIAAQNEYGAQIGTASLTIGATPPVWGGAGLVWGAVGSGGSGTLYTATQTNFVPRTQPIYWTAPLIFNKLQLTYSGTLTANGAGFGAQFMRYQKTGYMTTGLQ